MKKLLPPCWQEKLAPYQSEPSFKKLMAFLSGEYQSGKVIYPAKENIFRALESLDLPDVKVVILGQDPYHGPDQAIGLSFAVPNDLRKKPPSLQNIFKEIESDLGKPVDKTKSDLTAWVDQGVLLLNTILTVEAGKPLSHQKMGWEGFTDQVMQHLNEREKPVIFILWGSHAQKMKERIHSKHHVILESAHPSPLSAYRGFFGSQVFSKVNTELKKIGSKPIRWEKTTLEA